DVAGLGGGGQADDGQALQRPRGEGAAGGRRVVSGGGRPGRPPGGGGGLQAAGFGRVGGVARQAWGCGEAVVSLRRLDADEGLVVDSGDSAELGQVLVGGVEV